MASDIELRSSLYNVKNGRYVVGGNTEISNGILGWWNKKEIDYDITDILYTIESKYSGNPNMLAFAFYNDTRLNWLIPQYNNMINPEEELLTGVQVVIPTLERVDRLLRESLKVGGIKP